MRHFIVFGEPFDFAARARDRYPDCRVTVVIEHRRIPNSSDLGSADQVIAVTGSAVTAAVFSELPDDTPEPTDVVALVDHLALLAAAYAEETSLEFHSLDTITAIVDKSVMRRRLSGHPDLAVDAARPSSLDGLRTAAAAIGFPIVVKPTDSTGSQGVSVVHDGTALEGAWERATAITSGVLVEEYLVGQQYSVEAFSEGGRHVVLAVTRKFSEPETLVEVGHVLPATLSPADQQAFESRTRRLLDELGLRYGPSHTEYVLTHRGPVPIETHARVGGDDIYLMVQDAVGVDMDQLQVDQVLGDVVFDRLRPRPGPAQAVWFGASKGGVALADGSDDDHGAPGVDVTWLKNGLVPPLRSSADRAVQVRASGRTAAEALGRARSVVEQLADQSGLSAELTDDAQLV